MTIRPRRPSAPLRGTGLPLLPLPIIPLRLIPLPPLRLPLLPLVLTIALAACVAGPGSSPPGGSPGPSGGASPVPSQRYDHRTGPTDLLLRVARDGGLVPAWYASTALPLFSLYGDGRAIVPGAQAAIYPGPLLPALVQLTLTRDEVEALLARADAAGLLGPDASYDATGIMDASTTTFLVNVQGSHRVSAYALTEAGAGSGPSAAARARLLEFLGALPSGGATTTYEPTAVRLLVASFDPANDPAAATNEITRGRMAWPLPDIDLATAGVPLGDRRCLALDGADAAAFLRAARTASSLTLWTQDTAAYTLIARPLLPDESGCPS